MSDRPTMTEVLREQQWGKFVAGVLCLAVSAYLLVVLMQCL